MVSTTSQSAMASELQSTLVRTSIVCASSIQSLREPVQASILSQDVTSSSLPTKASVLSVQIVSDLTQLFALVQKHTTNLAIALKPSIKQSNGVSGIEVSPVSGLDDKSLQAAQAQITALGSDIIPKLVFLAKKAWKDREVFQKQTNTQAESPAQAEERAKLERLAKEMGAEIMTADQLGVPASERPDLRKLLEYSLGNSFAREVRSAVEVVLGSIADLFHSLLDERARKALQNASSARDKADGVTLPAKFQHAATPTTLSEARKQILSANNLVWENCARLTAERNADGSAKTITSVAPNGVRTKVQVKGLSRSNLEASKRSWHTRVELMRDGLEELQSGIEADSSDQGATNEEADEFSFPAATPLSPEQRNRLRQLSNLVKIGNLTHETLLKAIIKSDRDSALDLDEVEELGKQLEEAQDELVAACLYGEVDAGLEAQMFDQDAPPSDNENTDDDNDAELTDEQAIEKAILRTMEQYVLAAVNLSAYVTDRTDLVDKVHLACADDEDGDFASVFNAKFGRLSKVLTESSSDVQLPRSAASGPAGADPTASGQANADFKTHVFVQELHHIASQLGNGAKIIDRTVAKQLDRSDPLSAMREDYILPTFRDVCSADYKSDDVETGPEAPALYMCGNSLGPLSKLTKHYLHQELDAWGRKAVLGHFEHPHGDPWTQAEKRVGQLTADIVGAKPSETVVMGTLTGNLHTMLATFYRPATMPLGVGFHGDVEKALAQGAKRKHKILFEYKAFPSDQYALTSVIELNGLDAATSLVPLVPKGAGRTLDTADILATIDELGREGETALVLLGGIQYFTGQFFELEKLAAKAHEHGILFGVDLAHAFANVPLALHDWNIDFAVWCTYKYGSSGPGGIAGAFVHEKWHLGGEMGARLTRPAGWWGHNRSTRFSMPEEFSPMAGAEGWQVSNPSLLDMTALKGSLETLHRAATLVDQSAVTAADGKVGMGRVMPVLRSKSLRLTAYLETLLLSPGWFPDGFDINIVTPRDPLQRGSQLCVQIPERNTTGATASSAPPTMRGENAATTTTTADNVHKGKDVPPPIDGTRLIARAHRRAEKQHGLVADIRHPDMLRLAPLAQFSTFTEVWRTANVLRQSILAEVQSQTQD